MSGASNYIAVRYRLEHFGIMFVSVDNPLNCTHTLLTLT